MLIRGIPGLGLLRTTAKMLNQIFNAGVAPKKQAFENSIQNPHRLPFCYFGAVRKLYSESAQDIPDQAVDAVVRLFKKSPDMPEDFDFDLLIRNRIKDILAFLGGPMTRRAVEEFGPGFLVNLAKIRNITNIIPALINIKDDIANKKEESRAFKKEILEGTSGGRQVLAEGISEDNLSIEQLMHLLNSIMPAIRPLEDDTTMEEINGYIESLLRLKIIEDWLYYHPEILRNLFVP